MPQCGFRHSGIGFVLHEQKVVVVFRVQIRFFKVGNPVVFRRSLEVLAIAT
jgi:hypothetical protein